MIKFSSAVEGLYNLETNLSRYIEETPLFNSISSANFLVFDVEFSSVAFKYNYKSYLNYDKEDVVVFEKISNKLMENRNICYKSVPVVKVDDTPKLLILIQNPMNTNIILAAVIIEFANGFDINEVEPNINSYYLEEICYHIQTVKANYDRLYYLIDLFTELMMAKDKYMPYHMSNVANWCVELSMQLNLNEKQQLLLYVTALLHDVGKLFIEDVIINKPAKLTDEEFDLIKKHPVKGEQVIRTSLFGMEFLKEVPLIIRHHLEHYDGSGYPDGLKGEKIPYLSRILKVADAVDAMLSRRAYKESMSYEELIVELEESKGTVFEPFIVDAMIDVLENHIDKIKTNILFDSKFIPQASLSFYYKSFNRIKTFIGNLVIRDDKGQFLIHGTSIDTDELKKEDVYKATISFIGMNEFIEYRVKIDDIMIDKIILSEFRFLPTDKLFSISWDSNVYITKDNDDGVNVTMIRFGGESAVVQISNEDAQFFKHEVSQIYSLNFNEKLSELEIKMTLNARVIKYYKANNSYIYVLRYLDISPVDRDRIIRLLFRKQINARQKRLSAIGNVKEE